MVRQHAVNDMHIKYYRQRIFVLHCVNSFIYNKRIGLTCIDTLMCLNT